MNYRERQRRWTIPPGGQFINTSFHSFGFGFLKNVQKIFSETKFFKYLSDRFEIFEMKNEFRKIANLTKLPIRINSWFAAEFEILGFFQAKWIGLFLKCDIKGNQYWAELCSEDPSRSSVLAPSLLRYCSIIAQITWFTFKHSQIPSSKILFRNYNSIGLISDSSTLAGV